MKTHENKTLGDHPNDGNACQKEIFIPLHMVQNFLDIPFITCDEFDLSDRFFVVVVGIYCFSVLIMCVQSICVRSGQKCFLLNKYDSKACRYSLSRVPNFSSVKN